MCLPPRMMQGKNVFVAGIRELANLCQSQIWQSESDVGNLGWTWKTSVVGCVGALHWVRPLWLYTERLLLWVFIWCCDCSLQASILACLSHYCKTHWHTIARHFRLTHYRALENMAVMESCNVSWSRIGYLEGSQGLRLSEIPELAPLKGVLQLSTTVLGAFLLLCHDVGLVSLRWTAKSRYTKISRLYWLQLSHEINTVLQRNPPQPGGAVIIFTPLSHARWHTLVRC